MSFRALTALLACLAVAAAWPREEPWTLATPAPAVALRPDRLAGSESHACAACHAEVVAEWASSAHALAWADEVYQEELAGRDRPEHCHGCHVPVPMLAAPELTRPKARVEDREHGISCDACHLGASGAMLGANGATTDAHATERSAVLTSEGSSALCAACHSTNIGPVVGIAKDYFTSKQAERGRSCVGCHMAIVERAATESGAGVIAGRSHLLQTPRDPIFLARAFELSLEDRSGKAVVVVQNRAGHRVPGLKGRVIRFGVFPEDAADDAKPEAERVLDVGRYLPVDGKVEIALSRAAPSVRVRGWHHDPRAEKPVQFLDLVVASR